jgi:hypothetical protein
MKFLVLLRLHICYLVDRCVTEVTYLVEVTRIFNFPILPFIKTK